NGSSRKRPAHRHSTATDGQMPVPPTHNPDNPHLTKTNKKYFIKHMKRFSKIKNALSERKEHILVMLADAPEITITELAQVLDVSVVTIRNDLAALEEDGLLLRGHGGAIPAFHPAILQRMRTAREAKIEIARAAAAHISDGDTIMIAAGTTTALIPRFLRGKRQVHIVTNNTLLFPYIRTNPQLIVTIVGGSFRPSEESLTGPLTMETVKRFRVQRAFIGVDGIDPLQGVFANSVESGDFVRQMAAHASETIVLADAAKFNTPGFVQILPLSEIDYLITDAALSPTVEGILIEQNEKLQKVTIRRTSK
ncbi:MAG: DeoR/GlpR family DNA-binding transcription regulator, partial [Kiritimatiellia bacterium]